MTEPLDSPLVPTALARWLPLSAGLVLCAALVALPAQAAMWKWMDANGRVVYSDIPPAGDMKAERVTGPAARANPNAPKELLSQEAELKKRQLQRNEEETKTEKTKIDSGKRQEQCTLMRGQLKALQMDNVQHYRINERGERVVIDPAMRKQQAERIETYLKEQCQADR
ncbi:MAG: DUF4124 domain-containing protein [Pseudomonadota bacterium]|nr:DUF4124 domain-containing protein [Pseudomonadota bacterium]